jgi:hypothetical protein
MLPIKIQAPAVFVDSLRRMALNGTVTVGGSGSRSISFV